MSGGRSGGCNPPALGIRSSILCASSARITGRGLFNRDLEGSFSRFPHLIEQSSDELLNCPSAAFSRYSQVVKTTDSQSVGRSSILRSVTPPLTQSLRRLGYFYFTS